MLYLIDANVLVTANNQYYSLDRVPQFWDWIQAQAEAGTIKMPFEIHDEIARGNDDLAEWITLAHVREALVLQEEADADALNYVFANAYGENLTDTELVEVGRDPFLVAYGLMDEDRVIVTKEVSKPSKVGSSRKVPDACDDCGVTWMDDFKLYRELDFRINNA